MTYLFIATLFIVSLLLCLYAKNKLFKVIYIINELDKVNISNEEKARIASEYTVDLFHPIIGYRLFGGLIRRMPKAVYKVRKRLKK